MSEVLFDEQIEEFLRIVQGQAETQEEAAANIVRALDSVADSLHIGKVDTYLSVPQTKLREQIDDLSRVLYVKTEDIEPEPYAFTFSTGDGGLSVFTFYAMTGYSWGEKEKSIVGVLAHQIYLAFSQMMMSSLLKKSMLTDLSVGIPNMSGIMEFAGRLFGKGVLGIYCNLFQYS